MRVRLDLREVGFDHVGAPTWRLSTFSTWTVRSIWDLGNFIVQLDTRGDAAADYVAVVRSDGGWCRRCSVSDETGARSGDRAPDDQGRLECRDGDGPAARGLDRADPRLLLLVGALEFHGRALHADVSGRRSRRGDDRATTARGHAAPPRPRPPLHPDSNPDSVPDHHDTVHDTVRRAVRLDLIEARSRSDPCFRPSERSTRTGRGSPPLVPR